MLQSYSLKLSPPSLPPSPPPTIGLFIKYSPIGPLLLSRALIVAQGLDFREVLRKFGDQLRVLLLNKILLAEHPGMIREFVLVHRTLKT